MLRIKVRVKQEKDGKWFAEATNVPNAVAFGNTRKEAVKAVAELARRILIFKGYRPSTKGSRRKARP